MDLNKIFFWSDSQPTPGNGCQYGSDRARIQGITKVGCPYRTTRSEAEKIVRDMCKQYPGSVYCGKIGGAHASSKKEEPKMGMVVDKDGHGVGIVTDKGDVKKLPSPIPHPLPQIADEAGTVPIVQPLEKGDDQALAAQVKLGQEVAPIPPPPPPNLAPSKKLPPPLKQEPIPETTPKQNQDLLRQIEKGAKLKKSGISQQCDIGFYWSQKLGRCVAIKGSEDEKVDLASALRSKFASALPRSEEEVEILDY